MHAPGYCRIYIGRSFCRHFASLKVCLMNLRLRFVTCMRFLRNVDYGTKDKVFMRVTRILTIVLSVSSMYEAMS